VRLADFEGLWRVERAIEDRHAGQAGWFRGRAVFTPMPDGLAYREAGSLRLGAGPAVAASRAYLWREAGDAIEVWFGDGRLFHSFACGEAAPAATHHCPPDRYRVRYDFTIWPAWRAEWQVRGLRKDYALVSDYRRD
jgi:hypothetical protein